MTSTVEQGIIDFGDLTHDDERHGTAGGYTNHGCRCPACKAAFAQAIFVSGQRRKRRGLEPGDHRHGTPNGYSNWGCRCEECKQARADERAKARANRQRRVA